MHGALPIQCSAIDWRQERWWCSPCIRIIGPVPVLFQRPLTVGLMECYASTVPSLKQVRIKINGAQRQYGTVCMYRAVPYTPNQHRSTHQIFSDHCEDFFPSPIWQLFPYDLKSLHELLIDLVASLGDERIVRPLTGRADLDYPDRQVIGPLCGREVAEMRKCSFGSHVAVCPCTDLAGGLNEQVRIDVIS